MTEKFEAPPAGDRQEPRKIDRLDQQIDPENTQAESQKQAAMSRRRRSPEREIHAAVVKHLRLRARSGVLWLHCPNGGKRDKIGAALLKSMGTLAGAADLLFWHQGNAFALELKAPGGRLSEAQLEFLARFNDAGGHTAVAEGLDRALACLEAWGILVGRSQ